MPLLHLGLVVVTDSPCSGLLSRVPLQMSTWTLRELDLEQARSGALARNAVGTTAGQHGLVGRR